MDPVVSVQNNNFSGNPEKLAKVPGAIKEALTILWNLAKLVKISPGIIVGRHHTDRKTNGIAERAVHRVKEGTSAVLLQSSLG